MKVNIFPKGIRLNVNVIERLELQLVSYNSAVQRANNYTTRTPQEFFVLLSCYVKILMFLIEFSNHRSIQKNGRCPLGVMVKDQD